MQLRLPDRATGIIHLLPSALAIGPGLNEHAFLNSAEGRASAPWIVNAPYASFKLADDYECNSHLLGVILWFSQARLTSVTLFLKSRSKSWDDWSETVELDAEHALEQLLTSEFGAQRAFAWGSIDASYDPRSGSSGIAIRYV